MLLDLIRIKMKNLNEVSEIIDNHIIGEYLSKLETHRPVMQLFMRERIAESNQSDQEPNHDFGRPNILKLANRFESYADIENKIMNTPYVRRSSMSFPHVSNINPSSASDDGSIGNETNATDGDVSGISGIMV